MSNVKAGMVVIGISLALALAACSTVRTRPMLEINNSTITTKTGRAVPIADVRETIVAVGTKLGWKVVDVKPGLLEATLHLRDHSATVNIPYSATSYSIQFKSSVNLGEKDGLIHQNYNGWVQNFDRGINAELARL